MKNKDLILEEILNEVNMSPTALRAAVAKIPNAKAGLEFELIVTNLEEEDDDDYDPYEDFDSEPDYDTDENISTASFNALAQDVMQFFNGDHNSRRDVNRAIDLMREEWSDYIEGPLWDNYTSARIQDFIDQRYGRDYANQAELFKEIDTIDPYEEFKSRYFQTWVDNLEDDDNIDSYLEQFLEDTYGNTAMSGLASDGNLGLSWPNWTEPDEYDRRTRSTVDVGDFRRAVGMKTIKSNSYHGINKPMDAYVVEPDSSLSPTRGKGGEGLEFVSPPLDITTMIDQINKVKAWAKDGNAYTNDKTGLHMNISIPGYKLDKLDYVKLALFLGDKYILEKFGRLGNSYASSAFDQIASFIKQNPDKANRAVDAMRQNLNTVASKLIHNGYTNKFTSINTKENRVEFRSPGGDWLSMDTEEVVNTLLRTVYAMNIALHPEMERKEYQKKFAKLLTADKKDETDTIKYFTQFATGNLPRTALVSYIKNAQSKRDFAKKAKADRPQSSDSYDKLAADDEPYVDYDGIGGITFQIISRITGGVIQEFVVSPRITYSDVYDIAARIVRASGRSFDLVALKDTRDGQAGDILTRQPLSIGGERPVLSMQPMYIIRLANNQQAVSQFRAPDNEQARDIAVRMTREYGYRDSDWFLTLASDDTNTPIPGAGTQALQLPQAATASSDSLYSIVSRSNGREIVSFQAAGFYGASQNARRWAEQNHIDVANIAIRSPGNNSTWDLNGQLIRGIPTSQPTAAQPPRQYSQLEIDRGYDIAGNAIPANATATSSNITATNGTTYNILDSESRVVHTFNAASVTGARRYAVSYAEEHNLAAPWQLAEVPNRDESIEESILNEINMSPTSLEKFADTPFAQSMKVGFETEMYIPGLGGEEGEEEEEEDMDANEEFPSSASYRDRQRDVMNFFTGGSDINTRSDVESALESFYEAFSEYQYETYDNEFEGTDDYKDAVQEELGDTPADEASERELDDAKDNVRTAWMEENEEYTWGRFISRNSIDDMYDFMRWVNRNTRESLSWPYYTFSSSREEPTTDIGDVVDDFRRTTGYKARASGGYHGATRDESTWIFEPDSSLDSPNDDGDGGIELVSPPMNLEDGLAALENVFSWAKSNDYYTNRTTGFHIGVSIPNQTMENIDHLKVIMLLGDEYVLKAFGRAGSRWTKSSFDQAKREVRGRSGRKNIPDILDKMRGGLEDIAKKEINKLLVPRGDRYVSVNIKPNYIEFRSAGGNYFEQYEEIRKTMLRYVRVMGAAADPDDARQEYQKKLYKFVSGGISEKDNTMQLFAKYTAGAIDKEQLVKELRTAQERRKPVAPLGSGPVDGFLENEDGEQVVKINGTAPYDMIEAAVKFANARQMPLSDINLRYPGYSMVRVQYYSTHQNETDSVTLVYIPGVDLYTTYSSEITKMAIPVAEKYWGVSGLPQDRFAVRVLDEYSLSYMRDEVMRITTRGEDRAPSLPPTATQTAQDTASGNQRSGRYVIKYTDTGGEVHRFGAPTPQQAIEFANNFQRAYSTVMRWGGTIGGLRGIALYTIAPNTDEQELFYMGPGEAIVNQPASGTPSWADDPNITVTNNTPAIRNPGGSGTYALFSGDGEQLTDDSHFNNYQNALSYFTINYSSSLGTGWTVRQLS